MAAVVRTLILTLVLAGMVLYGFWRLTDGEQKALIAQLETMNAQLAGDLARREAMIGRLKRSHRLAHLQVLDQRMDVSGKVIGSTVRLIELDDAGAELARQTFDLPGDVLYVDAWTVKFAHDDIAHGHPLRGRTLVLLRRMYSDRLAPIEGLPIDTPGAVPPGYAASDAGRFEQQVWEHFWAIAADADLAESMGVRVAQGEAVYKKIGKGETYELLVDAVGGMNLKPLPAAMAEGPANAGILTATDETVGRRESLAGAD